MSSIAIERTDTRPAGRIKTGRRSRAVAKMLLVNRRSTIFLAVLLPLMVGAGLAATGLIVSQFRNYPKESYSYFFSENIFHQIVMGATFTLLSFNIITRQSKLIMGMGFTRKNLWHGFVIAALVKSFISTVVYTAGGLIETYTHGYGVGWKLISPALYMIGDSPLYVSLFDLLRYTSIWFIFLIAVHLLGAVLGLIYLRSGIIPTIFILLLFVSSIGIMSQYIFGNMYYDFGLQNLISPYYLDESGNEKPYPNIFSGMDYFGAPIYPTEEYLWGYTLKYLGLCSLGTLIVYAIGAFLFKKTDLR